MSDEELKKEIESIAGQLVEKYHAQKVILFGSAARGGFGPDSDLDFLIIKQDVPANRRERMREVRRLIEKRVPADYFVYTREELENRLRLGDPFLKAVIADGRVLYG
ncbi:nucleotidyltransferase domain-containing protein [candidate division TA06 bacterium]|uniref:Nucleotidyltransferase domain-containing protein n=1 Tax=candidate division TA06 bacterium TaxID=2250710 RepID=A0A933I8R9_UNCT6|nr:nucleotidyltransferase domain-containing protein [candidate division TA06 bacterium]